MTISLRDQFEGVLKKAGWNVYLQRRNGDSFSDQLEFHTVRNNFGSTHGATSEAQEEEEGVAVTPDNVFYFKWDVNPGEGDRIYERFPNQVNNTAVWLIDYAQPFRGFKGEIIYWACGVTREYVNRVAASSVTPGAPAPTPGGSTPDILDGGVI